MLYSLDFKFQFGWLTVIIHRYELGGIQYILKETHSYQCSKQNFLTTVNIDSSADLTLHFFQTKQVNLNTFSKMQDSFSSRVIIMKTYHLLKQRYVELHSD